MALRNLSLSSDDMGEKNTAINPGVKTTIKIILPILRVNYVFLVPLIVLSLPSAAVLGQGVPITIVLVAAGLAGTMTRNSVVASLASAALLGLLVWGRVASDLWGLGRLDTALLLLEFFAIILLVEASNIAIRFDLINRKLEGKEDDLTIASRVRLIGWARSQFFSLGKLIAGSFALTLSLLVLGDIVSVSINQVVFSAILVLVAVAALLVLVTYGREPEDLERSRVNSGASHSS